MEEHNSCDNGGVKYDNDDADPRRHSKPLLRRQLEVNGKERKLAEAVA